MSPEQHRRKHLRWEILAALHVARPGRLSAALIDSTISSRIGESTLKELHREAVYLSDMGLITLQDGRTWLAAITADGVDVVEGKAELPSGLVRPEDADKYETLNIRNADLRWRLLLTIESGSEYGVRDTVALSTVSDEALPVTKQDMLKELVYLEDSGLIEREGTSSRLTPLGTDVVAYDAEAPAGVARPSKYW